MKRKPTKKQLAKMDPRKRAAVLFYRRHRERLLQNANNYYAEHRDEVLEKAKVRYANKRPDYFCTICHKMLPRTVSGHHLFCEVCGPIYRKRRPHKDRILAVRALARAAKKAAKPVSKKATKPAKKSQKAKVAKAAKPVAKATTKAA